MNNLFRFIPGFILIAVVTFLTACQKEEITNTDKVQNVTGFAQKGPFISGSSVTLYDLLPDLTPTGKSFNSQITDNQGNFELDDILLSSDYIRLRVDGFYFNEITGKQSTAQLTLYALSEISDSGEINVNLMTLLEKPRVEYLMKNGGSFANAKAQAQKEVLAIFNINKEDIETSEKLNISENGEDNGILLAVSCILQGYRSEGELTELLANISNDIKEDGILSSDTLGSALINHAVSLDTAGIRANLVKRYSDIGVTASIPDFGKYISDFISKTKYPITGSLIDYPKTGMYGHNILALNDTLYTAGDCSLAANLADGTSLKVVIKALDPGGIWWITLGSEKNWTTSQYNGTQTFTSINPGTSCDMHMSQFAHGHYLIQYFEMGSKSPTRSKIIKVA